MLLALGLNACGGGTDRNGSEPASAANSGEADETAAARAYVDSFITRDPDECFGAVKLEQPRLDARGGAPFGPGVAPARVIVAIDGSGSMAGRIGGQTKLELARQAALSFLDGLPPTVEASLLTFGQQGDNSEAGKARSCAGVDMLVPLSTDRTRIAGAVKQVRAVGWTPLAAGLKRARSLLAASPAKGGQVIYVISDGEETCGGDPVAVARRINSGQARAVVNIIGFGLPSKEAGALKAVAEAGGGGFVNVANRAEYDRTVEMVREANRDARNAVRLSDADSANAVRTADVASHASLCISDIVADEANRMSDDLSRRWRQGEKVPFSTAALELQQERHRALLDRDKAFSRRLRDEEEAARTRMKAEAKAVR
ncbi:MAG: VWA domain-containing protein [Sphingobium sp.]